MHHVFDDFRPNFLSILRIKKARISYNVRGLTTRGTQPQHYTFTRKASTVDGSTRTSNGWAFADGACLRVVDSVYTRWEPPERGASTFLANEPHTQEATIHHDGGSMPMHGPALSTMYLTEAVRSHGQ